ncbi:2-polyprenyl-6-methoxyphenol hydroxylase-like FAD-dependent oxidoreductase [Prauserella sediminis]|uniref:2-polyprenyl-6-methoxyphenol hydroxylase-like FAD-dependent oxidoreductase n=1 Tax=Prauserella sediminis TaxID=577680 RepID=A0A839XGT4_9PSEU|nr:NAD(P)/FAD-dependent oxidoreductase [Prauserella sediminis]MBB3661687.1 2-polyprenyl-6-methoxyphenol hydroxylase-like FAD-dependent oxidoreductase [Prauserella sediminis]
MTAANTTADPRWDEADHADTVRADMVIVGGGVPSLVLAAGVARAAPDLDVMVLERAPRTARNRQGVLVHPATQVVLRRAGMTAVPDDAAGRIEYLEEFRHRRRVGRFDTRRRTTDGQVHTPYNIGLDTLADAVFPVLAATPNAACHYGVDLSEAVRQDDEWTLLTAGADGPQRVRTRLLVAADGRDSPLRQGVDFGVTRRLFPGRVDVVAVPVRRQGPPAISMVVGDHDATTIVDNGVGPNPLLFDMQPDGTAPDPAAVRLRPQARRRAEAVGLGLPDDVEPLLTTSLRSSTVRCGTWYRDDLLLLGDAAHAMHNLGGQGFNLAVQNAAALVDPVHTLLRTGSAAEVENLQRFRLPYITALQERQDDFFDALAAGEPPADGWLDPLHESLTTGQPGLDRYIEPLKELIRHA